MAFYLIRVIQRVQIQRWTALLADRDGELSKRVKAARILAEICDKRDTLLVEPLLGVLSDEENEIRCYAIEALSGIADRRAVEPICGALQDGDVDVRRLAAKALGKLGDTQAVKPLLKVLKDKKENMKVRKHAAEALGEIGAEKAVIPLVEFLKEEEKPGPAVYISKPGSYESYGHKGSELYYPVRDALEAIGERAVNLLINKLGDGSKDNKLLEVVAEVLGRIGDTRAVEPLVKLLDGEKGDYTLRKSIIFALGEIGDRRAIAPLIEVLKKQERDFTAALNVLREMHDRRVVKILIDLLGNLKKVEKVISTRDFGGVVETISGTGTYQDSIVSALRKITGAGEGLNDYHEWKKWHNKHQVDE